MARIGRASLAVGSARLKPIACATAVLALIGCTGSAISDTEAEALFQQRFAHYRAGEMDAIYDILAPVAGAGAYRPLAPAKDAERTIAADAVSQAREYARVNHSTAFLVWRNGRLQEESYFGGFDRDSPFNALSLAKPLAAIAVGRAIELGSIKSLDQPVAEFITEWQGTPKSQMLIGQLLRMSSGLQPQEFTFDPASVMNRAYLSPFHDKVLIDEYPLTEVPGTRFAYSNATAELVAVIIERATGRRYDQFLSEELLIPLGAMGGKIWLDRPDGVPHSGCCIMLPAESWLRLGILVMQDGLWEGRRLLGRDFVRAMVTPTTQNPHAAMMGVYVAGRYTPRRGFAGPDQPGPQVLHSEPYLSADLLLFDGNADQVLYIVPSADLVALRMGSAPPKQPEWDNSAIPNLLLRGIDWHGRRPIPQS